MQKRIEGCAKKELSDTNNCDMLTDYVKSKKDDIKNFLSGLGIDSTQIKNEELMLQSFVHKSYAADYMEPLVDNERLEYLGDSILGCIIAIEMFNTFPEYGEDKLTLYKIALVREETLAMAAQDIGLKNHIFISKGEERSAGREKKAILADCFEALLGYLYLDLGYDVARNIVLKHVFNKINNIEKLIPVKSYKSRVQEQIQKKFKILPSYLDNEHKIDETGNVQVYKADLYLDQQHLATGYGPSKKKAQEDAAREYLGEDKIEN